MYTVYDWNAVFKQLYTQLLWQSEKIAELEKKLDSIQEDLRALREVKPVNVERIEYNFEQLKVERLEGTLQIGISPDTGKSIEQLAVNGSEIVTGAGNGGNGGEAPPAPVTPGIEMFNGIRDPVLSYLATDAAGEIRTMEGQYGLVLGDAYREHILEDIRKQIDERIRVYMNRFVDAGSDDSDRSAELQQMIVDKVKEDIRMGIERYLQSFPKRSRVNDDEFAGDE